MTDAAPEFLPECPTGRLHKDPINPRTHVNIDDDFIASVRAGIVEPLIVRPQQQQQQLVDEVGPVDFLIVAGERRWNAATEADLDTVPVIVRYDLDNDADALQVMLIENGQRQSLSPLDEARGYAKLVDLGRSQRDIAKSVNCNQSNVSKRLSLLKLPARAQALLDSGRIGVKTALGLTGLVKHDDRLSKLLDFATQEDDVDEAEIAQYVHSELQQVEHEKNRARRIKERDALVAELVGRGLFHEDDDSDDSFEECDEDEATAFDLYGPDNTIMWLKPSTDAGARPQRQDTDDDEEETYNDALAKADSDREYELRIAARDARRSLAENLCRDGYPGDDLALQFTLEVIIEEAIENCGTDNIAALLGIDVAAIDADPEDDPAEIGVRAHDDLLRVAFANALGLGSFAPRDTPKQRVYLELLIEHGYEPLPEERALFGDTIPDGRFPSTLEEAHAAQPPIVEATADIATIGPPCPYCFKGYVVFEGTEQGHPDWRAATPDDAVETLRPCPDCDGTADIATIETRDDETGITYRTGPDFTEAVVDHLDLPAAPEGLFDDEADPNEPPFRAYDSFVPKSIIRVLNNTDTTAERCHAVITNEAAHDNRAPIIDAAQARLAQLEELEHAAG